MVESGLTCFLCSETYNITIKAPRFLACGHTYCSECCGIILSQVPCLCPEDNTPISYPSTESIPINVALFKLIQKPNICPEHKKKLEYVCINDQIKICSYCALMGAHKDHEIKAMEDVHNEVAMRTGCLMDMVEIIDKTEIELSDTIMVKLEEVAASYSVKKSQIELSVKNEFNIMRAQLDALEKNVLKDLQKHFDNIENVIVSSREFPKVIYRQASEWKDMAKDLLDLIDAKTDDPSYLLFKMLASGYIELFQTGEKLLTDLEGIKDIKIEKISEDIQSLSVEYTRNVIPSLCKVVFRSTNFSNDRTIENLNINEFNSTDDLQDNKNLIE
jgi:B-box zinc finger